MGPIVNADQFILAVPHHRVLGLLPPTLSDRPEWKKLDSIESAPISSLHLWFDRPITDLPHAVLIGCLSQWLFARPEIRLDQDIDQTAFVYQVVISASRHLSDMSQEAIQEQVLNELDRTLPGDRRCEAGPFPTRHRAPSGLLSDARH